MFFCLIVHRSDVRLNKKIRSETNCTDNDSISCTLHKIKERDIFNWLGFVGEQSRDRNDVRHDGPWSLHYKIQVGNHHVFSVWVPWWNWSSKNKRKCSFVRKHNKGFVFLCLESILLRKMGPQRVIEKAIGPIVPVIRFPYLMHWFDTPASACQPHCKLVPASSNSNQHQISGSVACKMFITARWGRSNCAPPKSHPKGATLINSFSNSFSTLVKATIK